jgi:hypothetical protein
VEPTLKIVRCPCCSKPLYTLSTLSPSAKDGWELTKDSPPVQQDNDGPYMKCARCSRRIALVRQKAKGSPGFRVATGQKCDRFLR